MSTLSTDILVGSVHIIKEHALKAPDALQLTAALELQQILREIDEPLIFIVDDDNLHEAAKKEGLEVINPREKGALKRLSQLTKGR